MDVVEWVKIFKTGKLSVRSFEAYGVEYVYIVKTASRLYQNIIVAVQCY